MTQRQNGGPKYKNIDWKIVEQALLAGSTGTRIAAYLGIHPDTLYNAVEREFGLKFTDYSAQKRSKGELLLEMAQFDEAYRKRDRAMLIWLGKNRLLQKENHDVKFSGDGFVAKVIHYGEEKDPQPYQSSQDHQTSKCQKPPTE